MRAEATGPRGAPGSKRASQRAVGVAAWALASQLAFAGEVGSSRVLRVPGGVEHPPHRSLFLSGLVRSGLGPLWLGTFKTQLQRHCAPSCNRDDLENCYFGGNKSK